MNSEQSREQVEVAWIGIFICSGLNHAYERQRLLFRIHFLLVAYGEGLEFMRFKVKHFWC